MALEQVRKDYDTDIFCYDPHLTLMGINKRNHKDENDVKKSIKEITSCFRHAKLISIGASPFGNSAVDIIICSRGYYIAIEAKHTKNKKGRPTDKQSAFLLGIAKAGGLSMCINETTLKECFDALRYVARLPYAGKDLPFNIGLTDFCNTASTFLPVE